MTKSSARKAAAQKAPDTYRKTARKVAAGNAHSKDRKTAPKALAERARGTYRKTAAQFEEFAYDGQMPESMRALAKKSVAQTRELYVHSLEAVLGSGLIQTQNAMMVARTTADRKLTASLS